MTTFVLPDLGEGLPDAEITKWYVKEGDKIQEDAPLVAMETAKAVVDVPSPFTGLIVKLHGQVGDIIKTGHPLVEYETTQQPINDKGTVVGAIESSNEIIGQSTFLTGKHTSTTSNIKATPSVRALAKKMGIDLNQIIPLRSDGVITADDLQKINIPHSDTSAYEPLKGSRRTMAYNMTKSHEEVVAVTLNDDANIFRKVDDLTLLIIKAIISGLKKEPSLNVWFETSTMSRLKHTNINLGIAVDSVDGLYVPVIHNIESKSDHEIRTLINDYKLQIQNKTIQPESLKNATFVLSNFGMFAGKYGTPIVIPPTVAILGMGQLHEKVIPKQNQTTIASCIPLSLTFDHRAVTGGEAARFLKEIKDYIYNQ